MEQRVVRPGGRSPVSSLRPTFRLAGASASHAVLRIETGARLTPLLGSVDESGEVTQIEITGRHVSFEELVRQRFSVDHGKALQQGTAALESNPTGAAGAVLITDQVLQIEQRALSVLLLDIRAYEETSASCTMVIPYRGGRTRHGFGVHRPTLVDVVGIDADLLESLMGEFFVGIESHRSGWAVWTASVVRELDTFYAA